MSQSRGEKAAHDSQKAKDNTCHHHNQLVFKIKCNPLKKADQSRVNQGCTHQSRQEGCDRKKASKGPDEKPIDNQTAKGDERGHKEEQVAGGKFGKVEAAPGFRGCLQPF